MLDVIDKAKDEDVIRKIKSYTKPITLISSGNKILWSITTENQRDIVLKGGVQIHSKASSCSLENRNDSSNTILKSLAYLKGE